ncbi:MAG: DUF3997 domain-containing protein [Thermoleophilia bacterium]
MKVKLLIAVIGTMLILIVSACDYSPSLGGKWYFDASGPHPFIDKNGGREGDPFIPCNVVAHASNDQYIIAAQKQDTDCRYGEKEVQFVEATRNSGNPVNFWIIDVAADKVIGPLSLNEYIQQRQQLEIPDDLKMDVKL